MQKYLRCCETRFCHHSSPAQPGSGCGGWNIFVDRWYCEVASSQQHQHMITDSTSAPPLSQQCLFKIFHKHQIEESLWWWRKCWRFCVNNVYDVILSPETDQRCVSESISGRQCSPHVNKHRAVITCLLQPLSPGKHITIMNTAGKLKKIFQPWSTLPSSKFNILEIASTRENTGWLIMTGIFLPERWDHFIHQTQTFYLDTLNRCISS